MRNRLYVYACKYNDQYDGRYDENGCAIPELRITVFGASI
jgi:hypothetical protein